MRAGWYVRRLSRMSPAEVGWRAADHARKTAWRRRQVRPRTPAPADSAGAPFTALLPDGAAERVPADVRKSVIVAADRLLHGEWEVQGLTRTDMDDPDWFLDPSTGRRSTPEAYAFSLHHRDGDQMGNIKQVWEASRLQHLTLLAAAWYLSGDDRYARRVSAQLSSWWEQNTFLSGVNWTSGIEAGLRLIAFVWIRRLLDGWPGAAGLFERNPLAVRQIRWHQQYLAAFRSRGSSANNHVIAEAAGQLAASCAFGWSGRSARWRVQSARLLECELLKNTFPSGLGREQATGYHCFVAQLALLAGIEAEAAGLVMSERFWQRLCAMADSGAALLDERQRAPRQGDGDDGRALLLDPPDGNDWAWLLGLGEAVFGRLPWWPHPAPSVFASLAGTLAGARRSVPGRPPHRPTRFPDAGLTLFITERGDAPEIWCRCDGGPHGFLSIAAHAHADALSLELRYGGVDILADPGTYCYHDEPKWRSYFRSTMAHNTVELAGRSQSAEGGPFMWLRQARTREVTVQDPDSSWTAEHDGYAQLKPPARHRRSVRLDRAGRSVEITDVVDGPGHRVAMAFHLGPQVHAELTRERAELSWRVDELSGAARLELPRGLDWSLVRGREDPPLGWYSPGLGRRVPTFTLLGCGQSKPGMPLITQLTFSDAPARDAVGLMTTSAVEAR